MTSYWYKAVCWSNKSVTSQPTHITVDNRHLVLSKSNLGAENHDLERLTSPTITLFKFYFMSGCFITSFSRTLSLFKSTTIVLGVSARTKGSLHLQVFSNTFCCTVRSAPWQVIFMSASSIRVILHPGTLRQFSLVLYQSKVNTSSRRLLHVTPKSLAFQSHTYTHTKKTSQLTAGQTLTLLLPSKNIQSHLISREGGKGEEKVKKSRIKGAYFKFRPTVQLGLKEFPHAPDALNPSTTPSSPLLLPLVLVFTEPSPSAYSKDRLTSCLPLTLSYPPPPPLSGRPPNRQDDQAGWNRQNAS